MYITSASKKELAFTSGLGVGSKGAAVKRLQEWLSLAGYGVSTDGDFGPATLAALKRFQAAQGGRPTGGLSAANWAALVQPMATVLESSTAAGADLPAACLQTAQANLAVHPVEMGGDNRGPWVRLYTGGNEGLEWRWCAGFVSFVMSQACAATGLAAPINGSLSCDTLALRAQAADRFVPGKQLVNLPAGAALPEACIFLVRRTSSDWTHTGFAFNFTDTTFETIEGNTNDDGNANGYEVCQRVRRVSESYDFIRLD